MNKNQKYITDDFINGTYQTDLRAYMKQVVEDNVTIENLDEQEWYKEHLIK